MSTNIRISPWGVYSAWHRNYVLFCKTLLINCLPPMSESIVYLVGFGYGFMPLVDRIEYQGVPVSYFRFLAPGMIAVGVLFQSFFEASYGSYMRFYSQKTWHVMLTAPVAFADVFIGEWLWASTRGVLAGVLTALAASVLGAYSIYALLPSLPIMFFGALVFSALGLATSALVRKIDELNVSVFLFIVPMFALSDTYFPMIGLPAWLRYIVSVLPFAVFVKLLRWPLAIPDNWLLCVTSLLLWLVCLGGIAYKAFRKKMFP